MDRRSVGTNLNKCKKRNVLEDSGFLRAPVTDGNRHGELWGYKPGSFLHIQPAVQENTAIRAGRLKVKKTQRAPERGMLAAGAAPESFVDGQRVNA